MEEELSFLRTLANGILKFEKYIETLVGKIIDGGFSFELFDTYGFPIDLTELMGREKGLKINMQDFQNYLQKTKRTLPKCISNRYRGLGRG